MEVKRLGSAAKRALLMLLYIHSNVAPAAIKAADAVCPVTSDPLANHLPTPPKEWVQGPDLSPMAPKVMCDPEKAPVWGLR